MERAKILGLNAARLFKIDVPKEKQASRFESTGDMSASLAQQGTR